MFGVRFAFLFGAGASFGAGALLPEPPPLGADLYIKLRSAFPQPWSWGGLAGRYDELFRSDFELGMASVWEEGALAWARGNQSNVRLLIDMARYFTQFEPAADASDLYSKFVRLLVDLRLVGRAGIATLNYECVLELASNRLGLPFAYSADEPAAGRLLVWKPHGSCNLLPAVSIWNFNIVMTAGGDIFEGGLRVPPPEPSEVRAEYDRGFALPPAMSLFAPGKPTPVAKSLAAEIRGQWASWVRQCDFITIVGARPLFADAHAWDPIVESQGQVWYVGGEGDFSELSAKAAGRAVHVAERFDAALEPLARKLEILA